MAEEKQTPKNSSQISQVSKFSLRLSYWYINNKLRLRQALVIFLILLSVGFYGYALIGGGKIVFIDDRNLYTSLNELTSNTIDYTAYHRANRPKDIEILSFDATDGRQGRYDFVARLFNPNENFSASAVELMLVVGSQVVAEKSVFILPGEKKFVVFFGEEVERFRDPTLKIIDTNWARQRSYKEFADIRLNFEISAIDFNSASSRRNAGQLAGSTLNFKIKNASAFSYWQVGVYAGLISAGEIVAVNFISLDLFESGATRDVEMIWYENLPTISDFEIIPEVNILDDGVYMLVK